MMTMFEVNKRELEAVFPSTPLDAVIRKPFVPSQMIEEMRRFLPPMTQQKMRRMKVHDRSQKSKSFDNNVGEGKAAAEKVSPSGFVLDGGMMESDVIYSD